MIRFNIFKKDTYTDENKHTKELGQDFYLEYDYVSNNLGGYHPVNIVLKSHTDRKCNHCITDKNGSFLKFPGVKKGSWEKEIDGKFCSAVLFTFSVSKFVDGVSYVIWLVQPDGRYFEDEDGFGGEKCSEIRLYSMMNTKGEFICPFTDEYLNGCGNCYTLY